LRIFPFILALCCAGLTAACAVGPDFERPAAPAETSYDEGAALKTASAGDKHGAAQNLTPGELLPAEWWQMFHSAPLNDLITEALQHNPDLEAAEASLRAANENLAAGEGELFPTFSADYSLTRQKTSGASNGGKFPGSIYTLHNASVNVSYGVDLFGGTRRTIEGLEAMRDYQSFQLEAARLSLAGNVVTAAIREASLRGQIAATKKLVDEQEKQVAIAKKQLDAGAVTRLALLSEQTTLAQTRATLPPLEQQLAETRHALSVLTGYAPSHAPKAAFELDSLHLPESLPLSLPSQLVEQRPDIRAAEANLHTASAAIGVALANRLPQLTLSGDMGSVAGQIGKLFTPGGGIWSIGGSLGETIFDAGTLEHKEDAAKANYDVAAAMYRKTVLTAFQDVADTLRALEADAKALQAQSEAERAAAESLKLARDQFDAGSISYLALLDSVNAEQKSRIALVQAEAQRFADTAALFQALGGGWNSSPTAKESTP
jgi:NodT family efflux transporter outer membrane factor (OMF) lipoprotein